MVRKRWIGGLLLAVAYMTRMALTQTVNAQPAAQTIELKPAPTLFTPKEFYIDNVVDERKNKGTIGSIIVPYGPSFKKQPVALKGGADYAVDQFITKSLTRKSNLRPIIFTIKELFVEETVQSGGMISGNLRAVIVFEIKRNFEQVKLIEYQGGTKYTRSMNRQFELEPVLSKNIGNALEYFNKWINREAPRHVKLAHGIRISISEIRNRADNDTLFYETGKRLAWSDFKSRPNVKSRFAAEVFPFFSFEESSKIENSVIHVDIKLKAYLVRSFSWVKAFARNAYTLNHEQRHFDMVKIASERFKKRLKTEKLTVDNYQGILSVEYLECLRDMNRMQEQYDTETRHGTDQAAQERWNSRIDEELKAYKLLSVNQG